MRRTSRISLALILALISGCFSVQSEPHILTAEHVSTPVALPAGKVPAPAPDMPKDDAAPVASLDALPASAPPPPAPPPPVQPMPEPMMAGPALETAKRESLGRISMNVAGEASSALARPMKPMPKPMESTDPLGGDTVSLDEEIAEATINSLVDPNVDRLSTFAIDVDTGSYTLARRFLENGATPNPGLVRVEEWVNAFHYSYPDEGSEHPFSIHMEAAPLARQTHVLRIGIQGKRVEKAERDPVHLTFLVDVSGSMQGSDRLPLAQKSLGILVDELGPKDSVSVVTYAGSTGVVLPATPVTDANRVRIKSALMNLRSGGGTNMGSGLELAYREATKMLGEKGISRVVVLSDGDANLGTVGAKDMLSAIKGYVSEGVTMSTVGFGTGNYRDGTMEQLADAGNGNYSYVGSLKDAKKIFVDDLTGTLQVIAKDTKIQVEMNPDVVASYRLIGYENRDVADRDFRNDKVDAGEIGAGHTVTALYEVTLKNDEPTGDIATVRVRYKQPRGERATEVTQAFTSTLVKHDVSEMSPDGRFAVGVGLAAEVFRHSPHMDRLGIDLGDAYRLMLSGASGRHGEERRELARLIAPLVNGDSVAAR